MLHGGIKIVHRPGFLNITNYSLPVGAHPSCDITIRFAQNTSTMVRYIAAKTMQQGWWSRASRNKALFRAYQPPLSLPLMTIVTFIGSEKAVQ